MKLEAAIKEFDLALCGEVAPRTRATYAQRLTYLLEHFGAEREIGSITASALREWRGELLARDERYTDHPTKPTEAGGLSLYTVRSVLASARRLFRFLHAEGLLGENPAEQLRSVKVPDGAPKAITDEDRRRLLAAAQDNARDHALVRLLADTGARAGAIRHLLLDNVDVERGQALVKEKGQRERYIFWGETTGAALRAWLNERPDSGPYLFPGRRNGRPLTGEGVHGILKRIAQRAGVQGRYNAHGLRHALARTILEQGGDMGLVADVLGHSDISTTHGFYARWSTEELKRRKRKFTKL